MSVSVEATVSTISRLTEDGHDVFFYDQVGGGLSARLDDVTQYTLERHIADLNAVYRKIGREQMILIGSSFGASLAANYIARYPEHVAAVVVSGSGPMYYPHYAETGDGSMDDVLSDDQKARMRKLIEKPRLFAALALAEINPNAAARFAPDAEVDALFDRVANEIYLPATVCPGNPINVRSEGYGFWSNRMTGRTLAQQHSDPRPTLRATGVPLLVIRGACDYKKESVAREYVDVFPRSRYQPMMDAGHMPFLESPDEYLDHVRTFLRDAMGSQ